MTIQLDNPALRIALTHVEILNNKYMWAELDVTEHHIWLTSGVIHTDGTHECAIQRRSYLVDREGNAYWDVHALI